MKNNESGEDHPATFNLQRLFRNSYIAEFGLAHGFRGQLSELKSAPLKPMSTLLVIANHSHWPRGAELIPASTTNHCGFEVLDHGTCPSEPLNRPITWWIERRFGEPIITFRVQASPAELSQLYGFGILELTGKEKTVDLQVDNYLSKKWSRIAQPLFGVAVSEETRPLVMIMRHGGKHIVCTLAIPTTWPDPDFDVIDEDIDGNSPLGVVHWRLELRATEKIYCSGFQCTREKALTFGRDIARHIGPRNSVRVIIENYHSDSWRSLRTPIAESRVLPQLSAADEDEMRCLATKRSAL